MVYDGLLLYAEILHYWSGVINKSSRFSLKIGIIQIFNTHVLTMLQTQILVLSYVVCTICHTIYVTIATNSC